MSAQHPLPVVLDTDIGSDVDDILALTLLANSPEFNLVGVTTVYGDTLLRARMVRYVLDHLGLSHIPVGVGDRETMSGRPVWWAGHEGASMPDLDQVPVDDMPPAQEFLQRAATQHHGDLHLLAIGPLTNIARAILADPAFGQAIAHLTIMGGGFWGQKVEHNIKCDAAAADIVVRSGIPMTFCGVDVTLQVKLREADMPRLRDAEHGLGAMLEEEVRRWWAHKNATENHLHDPLAVLSLIRPDLFRFEQCDIRTELEGPDAGRTHPERCGEGSIRIAADIDAPAAEQEIVRRIAGDGRGG
jgi:purine nucleosidase